MFDLGILLILLFFAVRWYIRNKQYKKTSYYGITKRPYWSLRYNKGCYGEYLIYNNLRAIEKEGGKFLFNLYIPAEAGKTTEIDVLMISKAGVFVFESKNYSGWIFGNEYQLYWTQTLPGKRGRSHKERFYNPVKQNQTHIKYLKSLIGDHTPIRSIIAFSDRCTLKEITMKSKDIYVINKYDVAEVLCSIFNDMEESGIELLRQEEIDAIYDKLYPYTQVSDEMKFQHIENIRAAQEKLYTEPEEIEELKPETIEEDVAKKEEGMSAEEDKLLCPLCGGRLLLRTAKRGQNAGNQFYGCSNYPKCRYIRDK